MNEVIQSLQQLSLAIKGSDEGRLKPLIQSVRSAIQKNMPSLSDEKKKLLKDLDLELSVWNEKISVILKEPVGRQGMAKHAMHWVERLKETAGKI